MGGILRGSRMVETDQLGTAICRDRSSLLMVLVRLRSETRAWTRLLSIETNVRIPCITPQRLTPRTHCQFSASAPR
jgi:hypothetical protein